MNNYFIDTFCCGTLEQSALTPKVEEKKYFTYLDSSSPSKSMLVVPPLVMLGDLLRNGVKNPSSIECFPDFVISGKDKTEHKTVENYITKLQAMQIDHIVEILLATKEEKPGLDRQRRSQIWRSLFKFTEEKIFSRDEGRECDEVAYQTFGNQDFVKILELSCQEIALFASALSWSEDKKTLEIISFKPATEDASDSLYYKMVQALGSKSHKINVYFDENMKVRKMNCIDSNGIVKKIDENQFNYFATGVLYNLLFHATAIHANMQIMNHFIASCLAKSTKHSTTMTNLMKLLIAEDHVVKYVETAAIFLGSTFGHEDFGKSKDKILTGEFGMGGSDEVSSILRQELIKWLTKSKDANHFTTKILLEKLYCIGEKEQVDTILDKMNIMSEYRKRVLLITLMDKDLSHILVTEKHAQLEKTQRKLSANIAHLGNENAASLSSFIQLLNVSDLIRESCRTFGRLSIMPEILRWRDIDQRDWNVVDIKVISHLTTTLLGAASNRR